MQSLFKIDMIKMGTDEKILPEIHDSKKLS